MLLKCAVVLLFSAYSWSMEIGDTCIANGDVAGTCKPISECPFAMRQLRDFIRPKTCLFMGRTRIVCCPPSDPREPIGILQINSGATQDVPPSPEPAGCPPLDPVPTKPTDIAFQKCLEYRRYISPCVANETDTDKFYRINGCRISEFFDRISDDTPAERKEFPHMALLGYQNEFDTDLDPHQWVVHGTLISDKYILTAAHVVAHRDFGILRYALLGVTDKSDAWDGVMYRIVSFVAHKLYERVQKAKLNDIALLELDRRVQFSEFIRPACLPSPGLEVMNIIRIVAGWTRTGDTPDVLLKEYIAEFDYETECKNSWPDAINNAFKRDSMICAGSGRGENATSRPRNSGGPLMALARDVHCTYIVRGLLSFGPASGQLNVYTDVSAYLPWIIATVWPTDAVQT